MTLENLVYMVGGFFAFPTLAFAATALAFAATAIPPALRAVAETYWVVRYSWATRHGRKRFPLSTWVASSITLFADRIGEQFKAWANGYTVQLDTARLRADLETKYVDSP